ncbi:hypothetical protein [Thermodesulfatator indicus]|nr:hypothetical protein [Thermodesulfatator indicus]
MENKLSLTKVKMGTGKFLILILPVPVIPVIVIRNFLPVPI